LKRWLFEDGANLQTPRERQLGFAYEFVSVGRIRPALYVENLFWKGEERSGFEERWEAQGRQPAAKGPYPWLVFQPILS